MAAAQAKSVTMLPNGKLKISFPYNLNMVANISSLASREFVREEGCWMCPPTKSNISALIEFGFTMPDGMEKTTARKSKLVGTKVKGLKRTLRPFQEEGVSFFDLKMWRLLLADEQGLGKTIQSIASLHEHPENLPAIIFTPSAVKENWKREILMTTDKLNPRILSGETPYALTPKANTVYIANYDIAVYWFGEEIKGKTREGKDKLTIKVKDHIARMGFKTIICDEIHMLKNYKAKRTKMLDAMSRMVPNFVGLSGTPMMNKPIELYPIIKMIDPHLFPNMMTFAQRYCGLKKSRWGWDFSGSSNSKELNEILTEQIMLRRLKRDVLTELPPKVNSVIPLEISNRSEYDKVLNETIDWVKLVGVDQAVKAKKAEAIIRYERLKQAAIKGKMESLCEWIQDFLDDGCEKLVVFAWHQDVIRELHRRFKKISVCPLVMGHRQKCVDAFNDDSKVSIFFGNVQSEGTGINLQVASNVVKAEIIPSPSLHAQASDRCHRIGQKDSVNVWWMIAKDTIEEKILKSLDKKKMVIAGVMDGEDVPDEDLLFDIFTSLKG